MQFQSHRYHHFDQKMCLLQPQKRHHLQRHLFLDRLLWLHYRHYYPAQMFQFQQFRFHFRHLRHRQNHRFLLAPCLYLRHHPYLHRKM